MWLLLLRGLCTFMSAYVPSCHECLCTDMSAMCTVMSDCVPSECVAIATAWPVYRHECHVCPAQLQPAECSSLRPNSPAVFGTRGGVC